MKSPEKFGFSPKQLLDLLTDIYLHLDSDALVVSVATDERSYNKDLFNQCVRILYNKGIKTEVWMLFHPYSKSCILVDYF